VAALPEAGNQPVEIISLTQSPAGKEFVTPCLTFYGGLIPAIENGKSKKWKARFTNSATSFPKLATLLTIEIQQDMLNWLEATERIAFQPR
jgi:hypothetical protein